MNEALSLVFYISTLSVAALLFHIGQKKGNRLYTTLAILIPTLIGGLRHAVGADYYSYVSKIKISTDMNMWEFSDKFNNMEPSLWILGRISESLSGGGILYFLLSSLLTVLFFYLGVKRFGVKHVGLFMLLILLTIFPQSLSGVRQGVAMALSFYALSFIPDKKLFKYLLLIAGASLFHYSALALMAVYPLYVWIIDRSKGERSYARRLSAVLLASPIIMIFGLYIIQHIPLLSKYAHYYTTLADRFSHLQGTHNILPELFALVFMIVFYKAIVKSSKLGKYSFMMVVFMLISTTLGLFLPLAGRFSDFFMPMFLLIFTKLVDIPQDNILKKCAYGVVILYAIAFFIGAFYIKGSGRIFPYQFIFM